MPLFWFGFQETKQSLYILVRVSRELTQNSTSLFVLCAKVLNDNLLYCCHEAIISGPVLAPGIF